MMETPEPKGLERFVGRDLFASDGVKLGNVKAFYYHRLSGVAEWISVGGGFLNSKQVIVPVAGSEFEDDGVYVPYRSDLIKDEPEVELDDGLSSEGESLLSSYFGLGAADVPDAVMDDLSDEPQKSGGLTIAPEG